MPLAHNAIHPRVTAAETWPFNSPEYTPFIDNAQETLKALKHFEQDVLSEQTAVCVLRKDYGDSEFSDCILGEDGLRGILETIGKTSEGSRFFFINRFLKLSKHSHLPTDASKLRISSSSFHALASYLHLPTSFVYAIALHHLPCGRGYHTSSSEPIKKNGDSNCESKKIHQLWYLLPVRTQYKCNDKDKAHIGSSAGSNQMNPFYYLHLADVELDIRGSHIAIFCRYDSEGEMMTAVVFNFMDGRWSKSVLEPKRRIKEGWEMRDCESRERLEKNPFYVHLVYFTSALRWWTNALGSVNDQLIAYELCLQMEVDSSTSVPTTFGVLNRALHSIAAHLQRYGSEIASMREALSDIVRHHKDFLKDARAVPLNPARHTNHVCDGLDEVVAHLRQVESFLQEIKVKVENILALLFSCIQIANDRRMVANGEKMHAILEATQDDARVSRDIAEQSKAIAEQSRILAEEMKQDSVAMKTIAVTTMFFLPGTSFAALLAMPFFNSNNFLNDPSKAWIWVICTVPSTILAFAFYFYWRHCEERRRKQSPALNRPPP